MSIGQRGIYRDPLGEMKMKRLILLFIALNIVLGISYGLDIKIEIKGGYFYPSEKAFKDIYGGGFSIGGEISVGVLKNLSIWVGGNYFTKKGKLTFTQEDTEIKLIPIGGGLKYEFPTGKFAPYLGLGVNYYLYEESNPLGDVSKGGLGYIGKIGSYVKVTGGLLVDLYVNYSYCKIKPADFKINIGGIEAGVGMGYSF